MVLGFAQKSAYKVRNINFYTSLQDFINFTPIFPLQYQPSKIMLKKLFETGVTPHLDDNDKNKIILTNQIGTIFVLIALPFAILYSFYYMPLAIAMFVAIAMLPFVYIFNSLHMYSAAKFLLATASNGFIWYLNLAFTDADAPMHAGVSLIQISLCILPFLIIDLKNIALFFATLLVCVGLLFSVKSLAWVVEPGSNLDFFKTDFFDYVFIASSVTVGGTQLVVFMQNAAKATNKTKILIDELTQKNTENQRKEQELNSYIAEIQKAQEDERKRNWASDGLAKFVEILRSTQNDVEQLCQNILSVLVKYVEANQGFIFIVEDNEPANPYLELKAAYAYERKKFLEKRITPGEGLTGQAWLEKDMILLTKVPQNYTFITSGTGEATPTCVVILPLIINEHVYGVVELATFKIFEPYKIEFLKKLCENIAGTVANVKINARTKALLDETQQREEQMRAQEEIMRQNMEELVATQEELARKSKEIEEIAQKEKEHYQAQLDAQKKLMEQYVAKSKATEDELRAKIKELENRTT